MSTNQTRRRGKQSIATTPAGSGAMQGTYLMRAVSATVEYFGANRNDILALEAQKSGGLY